MRKTTIILCLLCLFAVAPACMKTSEVHATVTRTQIIVNRVFTNDTTIKPTGLSDAIDKLTLYGQVDKLAPDFCVRMVLKATDGKEYLMMELYDALCDAPSRTFNDYAEETELLSSVTPDSIKIYVHNAQFSLTSLYKTVYTGNSYPNAIDPDTLRYRRAQAKVDTLNAVNVRQNKLWRAAVTDLSLKDHTTRKRVLGLGDGDSSYGMEYYGGGIFELGETPTNPIRDNSPYVDNFDWRNRHGKNWMTPVKNQGKSGTCVAFATVGCLEAWSNIYLNRKIDLNLSEQEVIWCNPSKNHYSYIPQDSALNYIKYIGVRDSLSYPFIDRDSLICESDIRDTIYYAKINDYQHLQTANIDSIKKHLIHDGPLLSGCFTTHLSHAMPIVGYHILSAGDTIAINDGHLTKDTIVIQEGDSRIGQTYWVMKNSYGLNYKWQKYHKGFFYILFTRISEENELLNVHYPYYVKYPIEVYLNKYTEVPEVPIWTDNDNDGFYYWGIGPKPANCPNWIPDIPDGDDSNPLLGPMDEYGFMDSLNVNPNMLDTIYINVDSISTHPEHFYNHVVLCNGATWLIQENVAFHNGAKLIIRENAHLNVKANGALRGANVISKSSSQVNVEDGGQIIRPTNGEFKVEVGSSFILTEGSIQ